MYHLDKQGQDIINLVFSLGQIFTQSRACLSPAPVSFPKEASGCVGEGAPWPMLILGGMLTVICWSQGQRLLAEWVLLAL